MRSVVNATMRRLLHLSRLVLVGSLLALSACSPKTPLSMDPKVATRQVNDAVPLGTSEARARKIFTDRGFEFAALGSEASANRLIVGTHTTPTTMWQVGFIIVNDRVAARTVAVTDLRPK